MVLKDVGIFRIEFNLAKIIIIFLIAAVVIVMPNIAYGQPIPYTPNTENINITTNKAVVFPFDDAYKSQYTNAKPILDKYGYKATFYIVCNYVENNGRLTWEDITSLYKEGHDIGSHTMNHADLSQTSKKETSYEIGESKNAFLTMALMQQASHILLMVELIKPQ
jgi:peptidoglycan/xylan/chitin deacetylase (PgdA/CDA1 family)